MSRPPKRVQDRGPKSSRGFVLIVGLLFLLVLTLLSVSMFRSFGLQERIAGNTRDKQRALEAAQSALQYGEWWLSQGNAGTGAACSGVVDGNAVSAMKVCSNDLANPATPPWSTRIDYLPAGMTVASGGGVTAGGDINYQTSPSLYIYYVGMTPDNKARLYRITAAGYGGNADTTAVVQSIYQVKTCSKDALSLQREPC